MALIHASAIAELALKQKLPAISYNHNFAESGGLMSYGVDLDDQLRRAATYVDRILKGARPGDLPVQQPSVVPACHQPEDRQGARADDPAVAARAGRSGDRVSRHRVGRSHRDDSNQAGFPLTGPPRRRGSIRESEEAAKLAIAR